MTVTGTGQVGNPYVVSANDAALDVLDTNTVDLTLTPGSPDVLSADVKLDPVAGNLISATANGLRVDCAAIAACGTTVSVDDTTTVNMTETPGGVITSDVKLDSQTPGNLITAVGPNGPQSGIRVDCSDIITCFDAGLGIDGPALATGLVQACISGDGGNGLSFGSDGCLYAAAGAGTPVTVTDTNSVDLTLTGQDISADVILDPEANNLLTVGPAGLDAQAHVDCGLVGNGTTGNPLRANVEPTFPFACGVASGGDVYCDPATGRLQVDPPHFQVNFAMATPSGGAALPITALSPVGVTSIVGIPQVLVINNPSPCRTMICFVEWGIMHALFSNPPGGGVGNSEIQFDGRLSIAGAAAGNQAATLGGHQHWRMTGQVAGDRFSFDSTKAFGGPGAATPTRQFNIAPGGAATLTLDGSFQTVGASQVPVATVDSLRFGAEIHGTTI